jgi:hypothetical protein
VRTVKLFDLKNRENAEKQGADHLERDAILTKLPCSGEILPASQ